MVECGDKLSTSRQETSNSSEHVGSSFHPLLLLLRDGFRLGEWSVLMLNEDR